MTLTSDRSVVVLEHDTDPHHYDLMIEHEDGLWTWSLYRDEFPEHVEDLELERIPDHRKAYLTYEGPVSGDRGYVRRVEEGTCTLTEIQPDSRFSGRFHGETWQFPFKLTPVDRKGRRGNRIWTLTNTLQEQ